MIFRGKFAAIGIVGVMLAISAAFVVGQGKGKRACEAAHREAFLEQVAMGQKAEAARLKIAAERDAAYRKLEVQANEDPIVVDRCLSPGRLRRLNAIR